MRRLTLLPLVAVVLLGGWADGSLGSHSSKIRVPQDQPTLQAAVSRARAGDSIVVSPGVYSGGVVVPRSKDHLTIRGVDRNAVVLDGRDRQKNGIVVHADAVTVINITAHDFLENAFYWADVKTFRAAYLTA